MLRAELVPGGTVMVEPAPVGVGGRKENDDAEQVDDTGALDTPPVEPADES